MQLWLWRALPYAIDRMEEDHTWYKLQREIFFMYLYDNQHAKIICNWSV